MKFELMYNEVLLLPSLFDLEIKLNCVIGLVFIV